MFEAVILKQFVTGQPAGAAKWVWCHRPGDVEVCRQAGGVLHGSSSWGTSIGDTVIEPDTPGHKTTEPDHSLASAVLCAGAPPPLPTLTFPLLPHPTFHPLPIPHLDCREPPQAPGQDCWRFGQPRHFYSMSTHGDRSGDPGCWTSNTLPRSRRDVQHSSKDPGGRASGYCGLGLHAGHNPPEPGLTRGFG